MNCKVFFGFILIRAALHFDSMNVRCKRGFSKEDCFYLYRPYDFDPPVEIVLKIIVHQLK
jgi:hypothetical protein